MRGARRLQTRAVIAFVATVASVGAAVGACTSYLRSNGEECIKDLDCLSGYCLAQVCGTPGPILNGSSYGDGGTSSGEDSGSTGTPETGTGADTSTPTGGDSAADAPSSPIDASGDELGEAAFPSDADDVVDLDASNRSDGSDDSGVDASGVPDGGAVDAASGQDASYQMSSRRNLFA